MTPFLILVLMFAALVVAALRGATADSRDVRFDLGRLDRPRGGAA
ncbi:hypothetical protein [uncultured Jatrophihabitans sp.]